MYIYIYIYYIYIYYIYISISAFQCLYIEGYLCLYEEFTSFNEATVSACKVISIVIKKIKRCNSEWLLRFFLISKTAYASRRLLYTCNSVRQA